MGTVSISRALHLLAQQDPTAVAVRCDETALTRRELDAASNRLARRWRAEGVALDDTVAIDLPNGVDFVVAAVAAWKCGATPMPLGPGLSSAERSAVLELVGPSLVVSAPLDSGLLQDAGPLPDLIASSWKTSTSGGSSGPAKVVRAAAPAEIEPSAAVAPFVPRSAVQLVASPLSGSACFVYAMRGLMTGHELVVMRDFDPSGWLRLVARHQVTWAVLAPSLMQQIWDVPDRTGHDVSSLEAVLHLGSRCPDHLKRSWLSWLGPERVVEVYAGTESAGLTMITGEEWLRHPGSVGRPVGDSRFTVLRPDGTRCGPGERGEVLMRRGGGRPTYSYLGADPVVRDGWHTLGDAGYLDVDGYLYLGDRIADLVQIGGVSVQPADVEAVLDAHPAVGSSLVLGRGEPAQLHAVVQPTHTTDSGTASGSRLDLDELREWIAARLEPPQRPRTWQLTDEPLRSAAGKARRSDWR